MCWCRNQVTIYCIITRRITQEVIRNVAKFLLISCALLSNIFHFANKPVQLSNLIRTLEIASFEDSTGLGKNPSTVAPIITC